MFKWIELKFLYNLFKNLFNKYVDIFYINFHFEKFEFFFLISSIHIYLFTERKLWLLLILAILSKT